MIPILILNVDAAPIPGAEKYLPEPAMGNQKPGTPEYQAKWNEKRMKQLQELSGHSFLSEPSAIQYAIVECDGIGFGDCKVHPYGNISAFLKSLEGQVFEVISGVHPTTHTRVLVNAMIRAGFQAPLGFAKRPKVNPWQFISTSAEGEYPNPWIALGKTVKGPVEDTYDLLKALGPGILQTKE